MTARVTLQIRLRNWLSAFWRRAWHDAEQAATAGPRVGPTRPLKTWETRACRREARWGQLWRPTNEQHLTSYAAWRRLQDRTARTLGVVLLGVLALGCTWRATRSAWELAARLGYAATEGPPVLSAVNQYIVWYAPVWLMALVVVGACGNDVFRLWYQYFAFQREAHGTARWAQMKQLAEARLVFEWHPATLAPPGKQPNISKTQRLKFRLVALAESWLRFSTRAGRDPLAAGYLPIAPLGRTRWLCYPLALVARHLCILGPPGSGKSASFLMLQARCFAFLGAAVLLDLKGEIYRHAARYFRLAYRFDLARPECSDRLLLGRMCYRDPVAASELAALIIGYDPNKQAHENPFWPQSATMLLTCLLLHLAESNRAFAPADVFRFLAENQYDEAAQDPAQKDPLSHHLAHSTRDVQERFAPFRQLDWKTKSNIVITMSASLRDFQDPAVARVLSPPTPAETARGCRIIDPVLLRRVGTGLFVVVPEGRAAQLANVLGTVFGTIANVLRRTGDAADLAAFLPLHAPRYLSDAEQTELEQTARRRYPHATAAQIQNASAQAAAELYVAQNGLAETVTNPAHCLLQCDEAGNVPLRNLSEDVGVGRGRRMAYVLGWQNLDQPAKQYGEAYAKSLLQSIGTRIALPGLNDRTAEYIVKLAGKTTSFTHSSDDAQDDRLDSVRLSETARDLISESELRTLPAYSQALVISTDLHPIRVGFGPNATELDSIELPAPNYAVTALPSPTVAEAASAPAAQAPVSPALAGSLPPAPVPRLWHTHVGAPPQLGDELFAEETDG